MNQTTETAASQEVLEPAYSPKPKRPTRRPLVLQDPSPSPSPSPDPYSPSGSRRGPAPA